MILDDDNAIKLWLSEFKDQANTLVSYQQVVDRFLLWVKYKKINLAAVNRQHVLEYQDFLANPQPQHLWCGPAKPKSDKDWKPFVTGLSVNSIKLNLQILGSCFHYLILNNYLTENPWRLVKKRKVQHGEIEKYLTSSAWQLFKNFICNLPQQTKLDQQYYHRSRWMVFLLYYTACRRHEIVLASMANFQFKRGLWWFCLVGKGNKYAEIPVVSQLLQELALYRKSIGLNSYPNSTETDIPLIINSYGKRMSDSMLYKSIKRLAANCADQIRDLHPHIAYALDNMSPHWLRHTAATHQVDSGLDIRMVKDNLRHSMLETTMRYQHTNQDARHQETEEKFGKA